MRPSILVVIFDFLVGSLLLFVVAPDVGDEAVPGQDSGDGAAAEEFSAAAIAAHFESSSTEWDREYLNSQLRAKQAENESLTARIRSVEGSLRETRNTIEETLSREADLKEKLKQSQIAAQEFQRQRDDANKRAGEAITAAKELAHSLDARSRGPYQAVVGSRCEVFISMEEEDTLSNDRIEARVYPVLFAAGNRRFLATIRSSLKLDWDQLVGDGDIIALRVTYGKPPWEDNRWSANSPGPLLALNGDCRIILLEVKDAQASAMSARPLVGRNHVVAQGLKDTFLVKSTIGAPIFPITASVHQENKRYIRVNPPTVLVQDQIPFIPGDRSGTPEPGDHLVTVEGNLIGIMINNRFAYILDESDVDDIRFRLPLHDNSEFVKQAKALHKAPP
jgi:hypothetical protein